MKGLHGERDSMKGGERVLNRQGLYCLHLEYDDDDDDDVVVVVVVVDSGEEEQN